MNDVPQIAVVVEDEPGCVFRFTYSSEDGEIVGKVCVADTKGEPDGRSLDEKRRAAELRIRNLCECIAQACDENQYAHRA